MFVYINLLASHKETAYKCFNIICWKVINYRIEQNDSWFWLISWLCLFFFVLLIFLKCIYKYTVHQQVRFFFVVMFQYFTLLIFEKFPTAVNVVTSQVGDKSSDVVGVCVYICICIYIYMKIYNKPVNYYYLFACICICIQIHTNQYTPQKGCVCFKQKTQKRKNREYSP